MIGKMKNKTKKTFIVKKKTEKSTDVELVNTESKKLKTEKKPKKRALAPDSCPAPPEKKKKLAEGKDENAKGETQKAKPQKNFQAGKTGVKSHKQEAEEAKGLKRMRKMREKKFYEVRVDVKKLWEELRKIDLESTKRLAVTNSMFKMVEGKMVHFVFAHDTSRCIQSLVKFGSASQKDVIFKELKGSFLKMMKSKFAKFCIRKFIKYGSKKHRAEVFNVFKGNVGGLLKHKEASEIVEMAYNDHADAQQRAAMEEEFYGSTYVVNKTLKTKNLLVFKEEQPEKISKVVLHMKEKLSALIEKSILQLSFVHKLLYSFFQVADDASKSELIEGLKEHLPHLVHTRDGARVAMRCLWFGSTKDRKAMVRSLKTYVMKVSQEEHGHMVMLALLDCVDDTRLVCKAILDEFLKDLDEVVNNQYSRKVLLYLLAPRNPMFFHPDVIKLLAVGDANPHSKKSTEIRRKELLAYLSTPVAKWFIPNAGKLTADNTLLLLLLAIVNNVIDDSGHVMERVAAMVAEDFPVKGFHFIDDTSGHLVLKKLIGKIDGGGVVKAREEGEEEVGEGGDGVVKEREVEEVEKVGDDDDCKEGDDEKVDDGKEEKMDEDKEDDGDDDDEKVVGDNDVAEKTAEKKTENVKNSFARVLVNAVSAEKMRSWLHCNRGCFVLVLLLELEDAEVTGKVRGALEGCRGVLKKVDSKGAKVLLRKLS